jgi:anti-sigma B factor antagonist
MSMQVTRETSGETTVLTLSGSVDIYTSPELRGELKVALEKEAPRILVDMGKVSFVDSSGLATLIEALQRMKVYGGKLRLCSLSANVLGVFQLANLDSIFEIRDSREAALQD